MSVLKIDQFRGIYPRVPEQLLPPQAATLSRWVDHQYGELRDMKEPMLKLVLPAAAWSIYVPQDQFSVGAPERFFSWIGDVEAVPAPARAPDQSAIYYVLAGSKTAWKTRIPSGTKQGGEPSESFFLGMPQPTDTSWSLGTATEPDPGPGVETRAYTITYVNGAGEEGPPAAAKTMRVLPGTTAIGLNITIPAFPANNNYEAVRRIRVYRTQSGGAIDDYYFVVQLEVFFGQAGTGITWVDNVTLVNEALSSYDNFPAPQLSGIAASPSGALVGWEGNTLYFSLEHKPWAWPKDNKIRLPSAIVRVVPHGTGLLALTRDRPYFISGVPFDVMPEPTPLELPYPAVARAAVANMAGKTAYATQDGIMVINGVAGSMELSERFFSREVWRERYGQNISLMAFLYFNEQLLVWSRIGQFTPFIIRMGEPFESMTELTGLTMQGAVVWPESDGVFIISNGVLYEFGVNTSDSYEAVWRSREVVMEKPINFGAAQARFSGDWNLILYADGQIRHTEILSSPTLTEKTFTLPSGYLATRYTVELKGKGVVKSLRFADKGRNLKDG